MFEGIKTDLTEVPPIAVVEVFEDDFDNPKDVPWIYAGRAPHENSILHVKCKCQRNKLNKDLVTLLPSYIYCEDDQDKQLNMDIVFFIGQCEECKTIYWSDFLDDEENMES